MMRTDQIEETFASASLESLRRHKPLYSGESRRSVLDQLFGRLAGKHVLVIGIGGGGDIVGALPTAFDLASIGATPYIAGISWKRGPHDQDALPRRISEFVEIEPIGTSLGIVTSATMLRNGVRHIEADIAGIVPYEVITIDLTDGATKVREDLSGYMKRRGIEAVVAIDVGGDALCFGDETTVRSPLCDQIMLASLSTFPDVTLGVVGLGGDGELLLEDFTRRFEQLKTAQAVIGALDINTEDIWRLHQALSFNKTESSRCAVTSREESPFELIELSRRLLNEGNLVTVLSLSKPRFIDLRGGTRRGQISSCSPFTIYFDASRVYATSLYPELIPENRTLEEIGRLFSESGYITEFEDVN